jgi:chromosome partitioning protein
VDAQPVGQFATSHGAAWEQADLHRSFVEPVNELRGRYDLIVFDCPPRLSLTSFAALCVSDFVIIPSEAADWGTQGIMRVTAAIDHMQGRFNRRLQLLG